MNTHAPPANPGALLREWRQRRRMSQLDLALEAEISQRHLSFVESGRASPSREMVMRLAETLDIPLRGRNRLLTAAGFAPVFSERPIDDPGLRPALDTVQLVLRGHEPHPAIAVDRHWHMVAANGAIHPFLEGISEPRLLQPPINVLRLSLHPDGLAPRIVNLGEWRHHLLERLRRQIDNSGDAELAALESELVSYPGNGPRPTARQSAEAAIAIPLRLRHGRDVLTFISTITVFGTPLDVTLSELAIESFFPADAETARILREMAGQN
jgi:transcriptional regulator with XRE-family HTH domain